MGLFILNQNSAQGGPTEEDFRVLECRNPSGCRPFSIDMGVDPQYSSSNPFLIVEPIITTCEINTIKKDMVGCLEMYDAIYPNNPPGTYTMRLDRNSTITLGYSILANFKPNGQVWQLPRPGTDYNYPNSGFIFPTAGGNQVQLNWHTRLIAPSGDSGLRYVTAGVYTGSVVVNVFGSSKYENGIRCNSSRWEKVNWTIYVDTKITITKKCTIRKVDPLNFGEHVSLNKEILAYSNIDIGCNSDDDINKVPFILKFNNGQNATANGQRRMRSGSNYIDYNIVYRSNKQPVGDVMGSQYTGAGSQTIGIQGSVPKREGKIPGGTYTDVVLLTLEY